MVEFAALVDRSVIASLTVKATVILIAGLIAIRVSRRSSASVRHLVLTGAFGVLLLMPVTTVTLPSIVMRIPVASLRTPLDWESPAGVDGWKPEPDVPMADARAGTGGRTVSVAVVAAVVWAAGAFTFALPVLLSCLQLRRWRQRGIPCRALQSTADRLAQELRLTRRVEVLLCEAIVGPLTYDTAHPTILLPMDVLTWPTEHIRFTLIHELEHVRRCDWLTHCLARAACALYWCHPLVWTLWRHLRLEAERACDDAVVRRGHAATYADLLVSLAQRHKGGVFPAPAMALRSDLAARVAGALARETPRDGVGMRSVAMTVAAVSVLAGAIAPLRATITHAQTAADERPAFAVASVKTNTSGDLRTLAPPPQPNGRYVATNITLELLIALAYQPLQRYEINGVPNWAKTARFDIEARADGNPAPPRVWLMLQSLLSDRFQLVAHRETRQLPIYALTTLNADQAGPRLRRHTGDAGCVDAAGTAPNDPRTLTPDKPLPPPPCGGFSGAPALGRLAAQRIGLDGLGRALSGQLGRMVLNRTGFKGAYDLTLEWTPLQPLAGPDAAVGAESPSDPARPSIFTAVREQLGLKLEAQTGPVDVLVIDHLDRPSAN